MAKKKQQPPKLEYMVRVKLPSSSGYPSCPSGDTDYEVDYHNALTKATPQGFTPKPLRLGHHWPKDSEGYTWVLLEPITEDKTHQHPPTPAHPAKPQPKKPYPYL